MPNLDGSLTWPEILEKKLAQLIWNRGRVVRGNPSGWSLRDELPASVTDVRMTDYGQTHHQAACQMASYSDFQEDDYGASMKMSCACGVINKDRVRLDMRLGEVLRELRKSD